MPAGVSIAEVTVAAQAAAGSVVRLAGEGLRRVVAGSSVVGKTSQMSSEPVPVAWYWTCWVWYSPGSRLVKLSWPLAGLTLTPTEPVEALIVPRGCR